MVHEESDIHFLEMMSAVFPLCVKRAYDVL